MKRHPELQRFVDEVSKKIHGRTLTESQEKNICVGCGEEIKGFRDELSKKEFSISGYCQQCQDSVFGE